MDENDVLEYYLSEIPNRYKLLYKPKVEAVIEDFNNKKISHIELMSLMLSFQIDIKIIEALENG